MNIEVKGRFGTVAALHAFERTMFGVNTNRPQTCCCIVAEADTR